MGWDDFSFGFGSSAVSYTPPTPPSTCGADFMTDFSGADFMADAAPTFTLQSDCFMSPDASNSATSTLGDFGAIDWSFDSNQDWLDPLGGSGIANDAQALNSLMGPYGLGSAGMDTSLSAISFDWGAMVNPTTPSFDFSDPNCSIQDPTFQTPGAGPVDDGLGLSYQGGVNRQPDGIKLMMRDLEEGADGVETDGTLLNAATYVGYRVGQAGLDLLNLDNGNPGELFDKLVEKYGEDGAIAFANTMRSGSPDDQANNIKKFAGITGVNPNQQVGLRYNNDVGSRVDHVATGVALTNTLKDAIPIPVVATPVAAVVSGGVVVGYEYLKATTEILRGIGDIADQDWLRNADALHGATAVVEAGKNLVNMAFPSWGIGHNENWADGIADYKYTKNTSASSLGGMLAGLQGVWKGVTK